MKTLLTATLLALLPLAGLADNGVERGDRLGLPTDLVFTKAAERAIVQELESRCDFRDAQGSPLGFRLNPYRLQSSIAGSRYLVAVTLLNPDRKPVDQVFITAEVQPLAPKPVSILRLDPKRCQKQ